MAGHGDFIVERGADHAVGIDDVGYSGGAQAKTAFNVIEAAHRECRVASHVVGCVAGCSEPPHRFHRVRAYPKDDGVAVLEFLVEVAELRDFYPSTVGERPDVKEKGYVLAPVV